MPVVKQQDIAKHKCSHQCIMRPLKERPIFPKPCLDSENNQPEGQKSEQRGQNKEEILG